MNERKVWNDEKWDEVTSANFEWPGQSNFEPASQDCMPTGSGDDRICDPSRGSRGHRHTSDHRVQAKAGRIVERHLNWHQQLIAIFAERFGFGQRRATDEHFRRVLLGLPADERGQSTVEYAIVMGACLAIFIALGALSGATGDGMLVEHAAASASHHIGGAIEGIVDVFCF